MIAGGRVRLGRWLGRAAGRRALERPVRGCGMFGIRGGLVGRRRVVALVGLGGHQEHRRCDAAAGADEREEDGQKESLHGLWPLVQNGRIISVACWP